MVNSVNARSYLSCQTCSVCIVMVMFVIHQSCLNFSEKKLQLEFKTLTDYIRACVITYKTQNETH